MTGGADSTPGGFSASSATGGTRRDRFFDWVRSRGMMRQGGWIGGVCAGIAARARVDPLVIRGMFVVAALLGLPMLIIYAIAWALLPDSNDRSPLQNTLNGRFDPAIFGVILAFLIGLVPVVPWGFGALLGSSFLMLNLAAGQTFVALLIIAIVIGIAILISRLSGRGNTPRSTVATRATATSVDAGTTAGAPMNSGSGAPASRTEPVIPDATPPAAPGADATDAEIAAWREQQTSWKAQEADWRVQQQDAERHAQEQARSEQQARAAAFAAEAAAQRAARRASKPRASAAFVAIVLGLAVVGGAATLLGATEDEGNPYLAPALGLLAAALIAALGMIIAGALRRRSGFLAFVTVVLLAFGAGTAAATLAPNVRLGYAHITNYDGFTGERHFTHPWSTLSVQLVDVQRETDPLIIDKGRGFVNIKVEPGVELELRADLGRDTELATFTYHPTSGSSYDSPEIDWAPIQQGGTYEGTFSFDEEAPLTRQVVDLTQITGSVHIHMYAPPEDAPVGATLTDDLLTVTNERTSRTTFTHPGGLLQLRLNDTRVDTRPFVIRKLEGHTEIEVQPGVDLDLDMQLGTGVVLTLEQKGTEESTVTVIDMEPSMRMGFSDGSSELTTYQLVHLTQDAGSIHVITYDPPETQVQEVEDDQ